MESVHKISELYQVLRPLWLRDMALGGGGAGANSGSASGMVAHALSSNWHTGTLAETQAPWAATKNEWATALASHAALPDVHHSRMHALVGGDHTASGLSAGWTLRASGSSVFEWAQLQHGDLGGVTADQHHNQVHSVIGGDHTISGSQFQLVGATGTNTLGLLTPLYNPGAAAAILRSSAAGELELPILTALTRVRSPLVDTASGNLTVQPAADLVLSPGSNLVRLASGRFFQSDNYASQTTGMRVSHAGEGDFRYLFVDEMHAKSFIADLEQALAGGQIISKSVAVLASAFAVPAAGAAATLRVRDLPSAANMACFQNGDIVRLRTFSRAAGSLTIADCWGVVTAYADGAGANEGTQTWTFTRSAAPNAGAMAAGATVQPDAIVLDYGTTGNGFYEINAIDGAYGQNSPYAQIVSWATHPATGQTVRSRLGNLRGIFGAANEYGLYAGAGTATSDAYLRISNTEVGLYNLPLRMYTGGTERVHIAAHNDVWIGPSSADKRLLWDGSTLTVKGAIVIQAGSSGIGTFTDAGALATASSASWATQVSGRPTELTDGRITTAIGAGGIVQSRVDPGVNWGANPGAGYAGLLLGADYMGYWTGTAWRSYMDSLGRFYLNAGTSSNYLSWNGTTLTIDGTIVVRGGSGIDSFTDAGALATADNLDDVPNGSTYARVNSTIISGGNIRVGSGTKDSTLNGWNIDSAEIVGQASGVDQVVLNSSGQILAGAGQVGLWSSGIGLSFPTNDTFTSTQRISFLRSTLTGTEQGYIGARTFSSGQDFQLEIVGLGYGSSWGSIKLVGSTTTAGAVSSNAGAVVVQAGNVFVPYRGLIVHDDFATYGTTIAASGSLLAKTLVVTGAVGYDWSSLTPATGWQNVGGGNAVLGVKRFGNLVSLKGLVSANTSLASGSTVYTLPSEYRPTATRVFNCRAYIGGVMTTVQINLQSDGQIKPQSAFSSGQWLSLEIMYFTGG